MYTICPFLKKMLFSSYRYQSETNSKLLQWDNECQLLQQVGETKLRDIFLESHVCRLSFRLKLINVCGTTCRNNTAQFPCKTALTVTYIFF